MLFEQIKLEDDEKMVKVVRKHWFILALYITIDIFLALLPLVLFLIVFPLIQSGIPGDNASLSLAAYRSELWFLYLGWLLLIWMHFANHLTDYMLDLWAITNRRIVAIDQRGYFNRFLSSFRLERLQDMNIKINGIIPTLLNFGTIEAQTAGGSNEEFSADNMPDPRGLKALIINLADERQEMTGYKFIDGL